MIKFLFQKFKRFLTFGMVGCINTLVDFLAFTFCHSLIKLSPEFSQAVGYATGITCSFLLNRNLTFRDGRGRPLEQFIRFLFVNGSFLTLSVILISILTDIGVNAYFAKIGITVTLGVLNYFGNKLIVFKVRKGRENHE
ncbi:MAG TPA: GtrA family protein [Clostridiales bacterium]|nr:GtrA family protein [Clostridiales bacterium]